MSTTTTTNGIKRAEYRAASAIPSYREAERHAVAALGRRLEALKRERGPVEDAAAAGSPEAAAALRRLVATIRRTASERTTRMLALTR